MLRELFVKRMINTNLSMMMYEHDTMDKNFAKEKIKQLNAVRTEQRQTVNAIFGNKEGFEMRVEARERAFELYKLGIYTVE